MGYGYAKLFADIVDSSIWEEDAETCKVWVTLLALCNADGLVRGSVGWLAGKARVSLEKCRMALAKFSSPDPRSRTPDNEGRRIEAVEDGWLVLNYLMFRDRLSTNPKCVATRERVRKHRERYNALRNASSVTSVTAPHSASASTSASGSALPLEEATGGKPKRVTFRPPTLEAVKLQAAKAGLPETEAVRFHAYYESNGWRVGKNPMRSWVAAMTNWKLNGHAYGTRTTNPEKPNPRNVGICTPSNPTDWEAASKRNQERWAEKHRQEELARKVASTPPGAPANPGG